MTPAPQFTLGVDLAQRSLRACIARNVDEVERPRALPQFELAADPCDPDALAPLKRWLDEAAPGEICARVVVESTGRLSERFARACESAGLPRAAVVNPARIKHFGLSLGAREKTDAWDAAAIALYGLVYKSEPQPARSTAETRVRELNRTREMLVGKRTALINAAADAADPSCADAIGQAAAAIGEQIQWLEEELEAAIATEPRLAGQVEALQQIPGIGKVNAFTMTAELGRLDRWSRTQIVAQAGLFPRRHESGSSVRRPPRVVKGGGKRLRRALYMAACVTFRGRGPLCDFARGLLDRGMKKMQVVVAVMRKLLLVARAVVVNGGQYVESKIGRPQLI